jgi:hypothetical protein
MRRNVYMLAATLAVLAVPGLVGTATGTTGVHRLGVRHTGGRAPRDGERGSHRAALGPRDGRGPRAPRPPLGREVGGLLP